jgi:hypothetical protein
MKVVSKFAAALLLGAIATAPQAALAKDKEAKGDKAKAPAALKLNLSKGFLAAYTPVVEAYSKKKDNAAAKAALPAAIAAIANEDDRYQAGVFAVTLGGALSDTQLQKQGVDLLLQSKTTPADMRTSFTYQKGAFAYDAKDFVGAATYMIEAYNAGFRNPNIEINVASALGQQKKYAEALPWIRKAIDSSTAANLKADSSWYALGANYAVKVGDKPATNQWLKDLVRSNGKPAYWHDALNLYIQSADTDRSESLDVFRLMRLTKAMLYEQDYAGFVEYADVVRYPTEVLGVLNEGFASGIISKKSIAFSEAYTTAQTKIKETESSIAQTEADARNSKNGYQTMLGAEVFLSRQQYAIARDLYQLALTKGSLVNKEGLDQTDRAILRLGVSQIGLGEIDAAKATFAKLKPGKRKDIAEYWLIYLDSQKAQPAA